ncbi:MAG: 50S ribosomal protein L29 [Patescibacteria group bacterium]
MLNITDLRSKEIIELKEELKKLEKDLSRRQEELMSGKGSKVHELKTFKKDIARINTVLSEKAILKEVK